MFYLEVLFYQYYYFLKKYSPSYLGVEGGASSFVVGVLFYLKLLTIYILVGSLFNILYLSEGLLLIAYFFVMAAFYVYLTRNKQRIIKQYTNSRFVKKRNYILLAILYPLLITTIFLITLRLILFN